jgi:hypothetical protein
VSASDFDFLYGSWHIAHRRLKERLTGCTDWEEFESDIVCRPILGGAGNIDEGYIAASDYHHMTIRLYQPDTDEWSLYWHTSRSGQRIEPPVTGRFADGVGLFYQPWEHNGIPVTCRYKWSDIKPDSVRWEQAFSTDDGLTWETNWIMDTTRTAPADAFTL